ncbi:MAG: DNA oxidative demethylase AlkB [Candidatus Solibacter sp.]
MDKLFEDVPPSREVLAVGAVLLRDFAHQAAQQLMRELGEIVAAAPFRHMVTPGGFRMSVAMTNCGQAGWVSDRKGYRYDALDPLSGLPWPPMPASFRALAESAAAEAGYLNFASDACLINRYEPGARLTLHQDRNEQDYTAPIVSVSLGLPAVFQFGGMSRKHRVRRYKLDSGDVVVWGGESRLAYHGVAALKNGEHPLTGPCRINLTFRKAL